MAALLLIGTVFFFFRMDVLGLFFDFGWWVWWIWWDFMVGQWGDVVRLAEVAIP